MILNNDWSFLNEGSVDDAADLFTNSFIDIAKQCIPRKEVIIRPNDKPWYDSEIRRTSKLRDKARKKAINSGDADNWAKYKSLRNKVNNMKKYARESFYNGIELNLSDAFSNDKKYFWKLVRYFVKENKTSNTIPTLKDNVGNIENFYFSDSEKADCLNNFFVSISTVDDTGASLPQMIHKTDQELDMVIINESEVNDILKILQCNKACGNDFINHKMLKGVSATISKPLTTLFNRSVVECHFPASWKIANVIPLFKKGCKQTPSNYRTVSLLSCVGKVMERIMFKHIYNHLHMNQLIYDKQSGFLPGHSTVYQLIDIYNQICQAFDARQTTCMVFCDISKAFDRVWHKGLLFKLRQNGISGNILNWLDNYLTNRQQYVSIRSTTSDTKSISAGVPQGSVLGPLLFLIYVNDITEHLLSISRLYADDSSLAFSSTNIDDLEGIINHDLVIISDWAKRWLVNFNPSKTEAMIFTFRQLERPLNLIFENTNIAFVENHKHLGLTLSDNGKWHSHIDNITAATSKVLCIMKKLKFRLCRNSLNQIYISYMRPILEYSAVVWDNCTEYEKDLLEKLQNEAARIVTGLTRSVSLDNLKQEVGWELLSVRRHLQKLSIMYKATNNQLPSYVTNLIPPPVNAVSNYNLRNQNNITIPNARLDIFKRSFIPSTVQLWNELDPSLRNLDTLKQFKTACAQQIYTNYNIPLYYIEGERFSTVMHARLRNNCSNLNSDLCNNYLRDNPFCNCSEVVEDAEHYFFQCQTYNAPRTVLFQSLRQYHPLSTNILLYGRREESNEYNFAIFKAVRIFVKSTKRFK